MAAPQLVWLFGELIGMILYCQFEAQKHQSMGSSTMRLTNSMSQPVDIEHIKRLCQQRCEESITLTKTQLISRENYRRIRILCDASKAAKMSTVTVIKYDVLEQILKEWLWKEFGTAATYEVRGETYSAHTFGH